MQLEMARLMTTLARNCPDRTDLHMSRWLYHLLCFAADASANHNWPLAAASLSAFASCLRAGGKLKVGWGTSYYFYCVWGGAGGG